MKICKYCRYCKENLNIQQSNILLGIAILGAPLPNFLNDDEIKECHNPYSSKYTYSIYDYDSCKEFKP